jgi:cupin fold WbuC family metalloprotein
VARKRKNLNLHGDLADPVQRFLNAMEPGTYVRPHCHADADKWELFIILSGAISVLVFTPEGKVIDRIELSPVGPVRGIEIPARTWHTLIAHAPGTVVYESKRGPYLPLSDKEFAIWAPLEDEASVDRFMAWFTTAQVGSMPPVR